jgi:O-antigen/teichoic acid export membrane protein
MDLRTSRPWKFMIRSSAFASSIALTAILILLVGGRSLVELLFGKEFLGAYPVLMVLLLVPLMGIFSFPLGPMLYALDRPDAPLKARLIGTVTFFVIVAPMSWAFGVTGAALAFVLGFATTLVALMLQLWAEYRRVRQGGDRWKPKSKNMHLDDNQQDGLE